MTDKQSTLLNPSTNPLGLPSPPKVNKRLIRLMIISAKLPKEMDSYVVVAVGHQSAKSREVKNSKEPYYDEHFTIDVADDAHGNYTVKLYDKHLLMDDLIGQYSAPLTDIDDEDEEETKEKRTEKTAKKEKPKEKDEKKDKKKEKEEETKKEKEKEKGKEKEKEKEKDDKVDKKKLDKNEKKTKDNEKKKKKEYELSWYARTPQAIPLTDPKDTSKEKALLYVRMRRENKVYGSLHIEVKEVELKSEEDLTVVARFGPDNKPSDPIPGKKNKFQPKALSYNFDVNDTNNTKDAFLEFYQKGSLVGLTRVNIYDARKKVKGKFDIMSERKDGHKDVAGSINLVATLQK